ncbi:MAG: FAD/NAD(P)-binding protein [Magnetospirillum sp.]|nr:FAD/NAD(P)-binding protein [Magnetospirillum sp.]
MTAAMRDPMLPRPFRIEKVRRELSDTFTMELVPAEGGGFAFAAGQFNMLYVFGIGEVPISISGDPGDGGKLIHTTRAVGAVTRAMDSMRAGDVVGVRGPFGTPWPVEEAFGHDLVFVAGGVGLAPLRPAIYQAMANRQRFGKVVVLYGARTPDDILFRRELERWRGRFDMEVHVTVDRGNPKWSGNVGVVPNLIAHAGFDPLSTTAFVCGPEVMMRYTALALEKNGVGREGIFLSMERNMKCGCGLCGHCQWGPHFVCKDGPVYRYDRIADLLAIREL